MRKYSNYLLIIGGVVLLADNLYDNQFQIDRENVWRIVSALCFITLGIVNFFSRKKKERRGV